MGEPYIDYGVLNGDETLQVRGQDGRGRPSGEQFQCTTAQIAALGGSGGYLLEELVSSGTSHTTTSASTNVLWNSSTSGNKTNYIPAATGTREIITITDVKGNAGTYSIQAVPASGSIIGNDTVYSNYGSITLYDSDTLLEWVSQ